MNRREVIKIGAAGAAVTALAGTGTLAMATDKRIKVAFMISPEANVIDTAGPWEVFQDFIPQNWATRGIYKFPFELYTVASTSEPVEMTGGLTIVPNYSHADAPQPNVIIVPDMQGSASGDRWLKQASAKADITASICTGAFHLARLGLFDGVPATTHHASYDRLAKQFPAINLQKGRRFVDAGKVMSAGGLTSGIDPALHIVARYFSEAEASDLAAWLEHDSQGWRTGVRA